MTCLQLSKVNPEGSSGSQPSVLTLPKKTNDPIAAGDRVYLKEGKVGKLTNYIQEFLPTSDVVPPTSGAATVVESPSQVGFVFGSDDRFVGMLKPTYQHPDQETFYLTVYDRVNDKYTKRLFQVEDTGGTGVRDMRVLDMYAVSPNKDKVALVIGGDDGRFFLIRLEGTSNDVDTFTINLQAGGVDSLLILPTSARTAAYPWDFENDICHLHWQDNDFIWFKHAYNTANEIACHKMGPAGFITTTTAPFGSIQAMDRRSEAFQSTVAGNILVQNKAGFLILFDSTMQQLATFPEDPFSDEYRSLSYCGGNTYVSLVNATPSGAHVRVITLNETTNSITVVNRTVQWDLEGEDDEQLIALFETDDVIVLSSYSILDIPIRYYKVPKDPTTGILEDQAETLPEIRGSSRQNPELNGKFYVDFDRDVWQRPEGHGTIVTAMLVEEKLESLEGTRIPDVYLGTCLSTTTDEVEVSVETPLTANNEFKDSSFGNFAYVNDDYVVETFYPKYTLDVTEGVFTTPNIIHFPNGFEITANSGFSFEADRCLYYRTTGRSQTTVFALDGEVFPVGLYGASGSRQTVSEFKVNSKINVSGAAFDNMTVIAGDKK